MVYFALLVCCSLVKTLGWVLKGVYSTLYSLCSAYIVAVRTNGILILPNISTIIRCNIQRFVQCMYCGGRHKWNTYGNLPQWSVGEGKGDRGTSNHRCQRFLQEKKTGITYLFCFLNNPLLRNP